MMTSGIRLRFPKWLETQQLNLRSPSPQRGAGVRGVRLPRRPLHRPATQNVEMEVKYRLAPVGVRIHHHAVALRPDPRVLPDFPCKRQQFPERRRILPIVQVSDVSRGYDGKVRLRLSI